MVGNIIKIIKNLVLLVYYKARIYYYSVGNIVIVFPLPFSQDFSQDGEINKGNKDNDEVITSTHTQTDTESITRDEWGHPVRKIDKAVLESILSN